MNIENIYKGIINGIGEAIFIHHPQTGIVKDVNDPMLKMYGYKKHEVIGKSVEMLSSAKEGFTGEKALAHIQNALNGNIELFEWKALKKDGSSFWAEVSLKYTEIEEEKWLVAVVRDISDKKKNEKIISRFTEFQFLLSELSTKFISISISKIDSEIDYALSIIGQRLLVARSYIFMYSNRHTTMSNTHEWCNIGIEPYKDELQNLLIKDYSWNYNTLTQLGIIDIPDVSKLGKDQIVEKTEFEREGIKSILIVPFLNNGKVIGFIGVDSCKTRRKWKKVEKDELRAIGNIIGQSIVRRNYEQMLKKSKIKAEESDRLKTAFLSNMSHEIRTPMNGILGFSELLEDNEISVNERKQFIKIIQDSSKQLLSIINDIIDISKIEAGQININIETVNINDLLHEIFDFFKPIAEKKQIQLQLKNKIPKANLNTKTDAVKVKQIFTNLISNAIKFTPNGYVSILANFEQNNFIFNIEDSGIGMDIDTQSIIFKRFRRADDEFSINISGTGLGLSISKAYAIKLGGNISVKSKKGSGSVFIFSLPQTFSSSSGRI